MPRTRAGPRKLRVVWCGLPSAEPNVDAVARRHWADMFKAHGFTGSDVEFDVARASPASPSPNDEWLRVGRRAIESRPDLLLVNYNWVEVLRPLTRDIPIVFIGMIDPESFGSIQSRRRPGGNITGVLTPYLQLIEKRIELLKEMRPAIRRVGVVFIPGAFDARIDESAKAVARKLGIESAAIPIADPLARDRIADAVASARADAADILLGDSQMHPSTLPELARRGIPVSCNFAGSVKTGAVLSIEVLDVEEIAVSLAARVLRGEPVATLPAQEAREFRLVVNSKTAAALGIRIPASILVRAHEMVN